jgi:predicted ATPase
VAYHWDSWLHHGAASCEIAAGGAQRYTPHFAIARRRAPSQFAGRVDHSWQLLTPPEQCALAAMSIFRGGFTREAAQVVAGASSAMLSSLSNQSLVQRLPSGRFDLHELVRQFSAEKLTEIEAGRDNAGRDRHCAYYAFSGGREACAERQAGRDRDQRRIDNVRLM